MHWIHTPVLVAERKSFEKVPFCISMYSGLKWLTDFMPSLCGQNCRQHHARLFKFLSFFFILHWIKANQQNEPVFDCGVQWFWRMVEIKMYETTLTINSDCKLWFVLDFVWNHSKICAHFKYLLTKRFSKLRFRNNNNNNNAKPTALEYAACNMVMVFLYLASMNCSAREQMKDENQKGQSFSVHL